MTANTETEQLHQLLELVLTELDRKSIPFAYMQEIDRKGKAFIEQAARRAPAVPDGWKLVPAEPCTEMRLAGKQTIRGSADITFDGQRAVVIYRAMLAAAPQPPEAGSNSHEFDGIKPEAAPVQMPEPSEYQSRMKPTWDEKHPWTDWEKCNPGSAADYERVPVLHDWKHEVRRLYTEQQVRKLLAAHGIGKDKA